MSRYLISLFVSLSILSLVSAHKVAPYESYTPPMFAVYACNYQTYSMPAFCEGAQTDYTIRYACYCSNINAMATITGCLSHGQRNNTAAFEFIIKMCEEYGNKTTTPEKFAASYDYYVKNAKLPSEVENYNISAVVDFPIKTTDEEAELYAAAYEVYLGNYQNSLYYGAAMIGYWALVFICIASCNWVRYLFPNFTKYFTGPITNTYRKYISLPALGRKKKNNEQKIFKVFDCLLPTRLESLTLLGFIGVTIACSANDIYYVDNDPMFGSKSQALLRYVADRTGIIATVCVPLLILFAGRNNFLMGMTMINFSTFMLYHRWVARVVVLLIIVHSITYSVSFGSEYKEDMKENYLIWGTVGTLSGGLIMIQGMLYLRRRWYEIFLLIHIILAALFIVGSWYHVIDLGYAWFFYAAIAVWAFDRFVRIVRLVWFGFPKADVILLADETLKIVVPKPKYWYSIPGGHAFIHFLRPSCFWQSHPFTFTESVETKDKITLYCKVKGGVTHGLYQYLASHPGKKTKIRVGLEGPYGEATAAKKYDTAVFVAGGNGIPGIYSEVYDLAARSPDNIKQRLRLYWIIREYKSLCWFYEELIALKNTKIETTIYVTRPNLKDGLREFNRRLPLIDDEPESVDAQKNEIKSEERKAESDEENFQKASSGSEEDLSEEYFSRIIDKIHAELPHIKFEEGRPSMEELVRQETEESAGSVAFVACGHPVMVDDLRYGVVQHLDKAEGKRLDFFEQLQVWA